MLALNAGIGEVVAMHPVDGGANNRVYKIECKEKKALLKAYFSHPSDPRDRLGAEFFFMKFAWLVGIRAIPEPLGCDRANGIAIYEWVDGYSLKPGEIKLKHVLQALDFFIELNKSKNSAYDLNAGSEACFSLSDHMNMIERRVLRLISVNPFSETDRQANEFVKQKLLLAWKEVQEKIIKEIKSIGIKIDDPLAPTNRCISPSDFGFHNAIVTNGEKIKFIDFEYAGWDDPAKTVCDFFCQPKIPVPYEFFDIFTEKVVKGLPEQERHRLRILSLFPAYQIKWCCIILNDFLQVGGERRRFANDGFDLEKQKAIQLKKAEALLNRINVN